MLDRLAATDAWSTRAAARSASARTASPRRRSCATTASPHAPFAVIEAEADLDRGSADALPRHPEGGPARLRRQGPGAGRAARRPAGGVRRGRRRGRGARAADAARPRAVGGAGPRRSRHGAVVPPAENCARRRDPRRLGRAGPGRTAPRSTPRSSWPPASPAVLGYVGTIGVELFVCDGALLVNEIAPRPHNSGHYTLDACTTSQFEQQVRALCGLPLADVGAHSAAVMVNLLGDLWFDDAGGSGSRTGLRSSPSPACGSTSTARPRPARAGRWATSPSSPTTPAWRSPAPPPGAPRSGSTRASDATSTAPAAVGPDGAMRFSEGDGGR